MSVALQDVTSEDSSVVDDQLTPSQSSEEAPKLLPFRIHHHEQAACHCQIPSSDVQLLDHYKASFLASFSPTSDNLLDLKSTPAAKALHFVQYLSGCDVPKSTLRALLRAFEDEFLADVDIHSLCQNIAKSLRGQKETLRVYYSACYSSGLEPISHSSALLEAASSGNVGLGAVFGGQGVGNPVCIQELRALYSSYPSYLEELFLSIAPLLRSLSQLPSVRSYYQGRYIDLFAWLNEPYLILSDSFVANAPVSFPIVGLLDLAHYCILCKVSQKTPGQLGSLLQGVSGHSQGIVIAAAISRSDSWASFYDTAKLVIKLLFWLGYETHCDSPRSALSASSIQRSLGRNEGQPSPLLSVRGLSRGSLDSVLTKINNDLPTSETIYVALRNTIDNFVVAAPSRSLLILSDYLQSIKAEEDSDQSRIPFSQRKAVIRSLFLPISAPFHTPYLGNAASRTKDRLAKLQFKTDELRIPVYHSMTGLDLRLHGSANVIEMLIDSIATQFVDFPAMLQRFTGVSHLLTFGGVGPLVSLNTDGTGVQVIMASHLEGTEKLGAKSDIFSPSLSPQAQLESWATKFQPKLIKSSSGEVLLDTKLSRLLKTPPIMVAGMTPTTVPSDFVSAVMNCGYHIELAGGGYFSSDSMTAAINNIISTVPSGRGLTCNIIYASPHIVAWQIPLLRRLYLKGYPIEGLTIGAGIPSPAVLEEYIQTLGLKHISLKPGSEGGIREVIAVAKAYPKFPFILQWTGGRGGGHHSFEDVHAPILNLYSEIRGCDNIILVFGSGLGDAESAYPYLSGRWALQFERSLMPFDGILLGSRMMIARESHTSLSVKELIVNTKGISNSKWEGTYSQSTGGVITVVSEMGQPIHKIATRGVLLWAELDRTVFSLPRDKRLPVLLKKRDYIISRLNADFQKPWFGTTSAGETVDLSEMTYAEVLTRLVDLMYVSSQGRWIDESYRVMVLDIAKRMLRRFSARFTWTKTALEKPYDCVDELIKACPEFKSQTLYPEDVMFFLARFRARGKPVNFIPVLDDNFESYFKKDSLWQSEDIDAVIGRDPGRVCILHGPVAAQYSKRVDETAKEILEKINNDLISMVSKDFRLGLGTSPIVDEKNIFSILQPDEHRKVEIEESKDGILIRRSIASSGDVLEWSRELPAELPSWVRKVFTEDFILQGRKRLPNPYQRILILRKDEILCIRQHEVVLLATEEACAPRLLARLSCEDGRNISTELYFPSPHNNDHIPLRLKLVHDPQRASGSLQEVIGGRNLRIKDFYAQLWLNEKGATKAAVDSTFHGHETSLTYDMLLEFTSTISNCFESAEMLPTGNFFPMDYCIVIAWDVLIKPLLLTDIDGDLLRLVHLSNSFEYVTGAEPLRVGDNVTCSSTIQGISVGDAGKTVTVRAVIFRGDDPVVEVTSAFLFKGDFDDLPGSTFQNTKEEEMEMHIASNQEEQILRSREWFVLDDSSTKLVGTTLLFKPRTRVTFKTKSMFQSMRVHGDILSSTSNWTRKKTGEILFESTECQGNPVVDFLERYGVPAFPKGDLEKPGWAEDSTHFVTIPATNEAYGRVSKDSNPIHTSPTFAAYADLPGTITHGMFSSAVVRSIVEFAAADGQRRRFRKFSAQFTGMVLPGDELEINFKHTAMVSGRMLFSITTLNKATQEVVLEGLAEIEQPATAYVFTGQGSQSAGMGMDLYRSSAAAKKVWDDAEEYLLERFGWSVLDVVRNNPQKLTVHFRGEKGRKIRENYLSLTVDTFQEDGTKVPVPIIKDLDSQSLSYTFYDSRGLLFSTQFAQPTILITEKAAYEDLRAKGLIQENATFAGHSLGEYAALSAFAEFVPFESIINIVFYRGLTMQNAMERDAEGQTKYSMVAVNPKRVGKFFDESALRTLIHMIATQSNELLEIVNYNVQGEQYVCAGHINNIQCLTEILNVLATRPDGSHLATEILKCSTKGSPEKNPTFVADTVKRTQQLPGRVELKRGAATIPLQGIDVPFHSTLLRPGVNQYRSFLYGCVKEDYVQPSKLIGKFIPNLIGRPFSLDKAFLQDVFDLTGSSVIKSLLSSGA